MTDAQRIREALHGLGSATRQAVVKVSLEEALAALPELEQSELQGMAQALAKGVPKAGTWTALEILAAIGMLWAEMQ